MQHVPGVDSTPMKLFSLLLDRSTALALQVMTPLAKGSLQLSSLKRLMKPQGGGQVHQTVHTRGDIVSSTNGTRMFIAMVEDGHVLLVKDIMDEDQSNSHTTTIMG